MTWGNNGAGPTGVQPFAPGIVGQPAGQAGANLPPFYAAGFEATYAAMCRGEIPANIAIAASGLAGVGVVTAVSLLQAISQGVPQNGTNGLGVKSGPSQGEGTAAAGLNGTSFGGTQIVDAKAMANVPALSSPIQYDGN